MDWIWTLCWLSVREDTIAKKVYGVYLNAIGTITDSAEHVLYDYTLQVGDTFKRAYTVNHYVADIDSVLINSTWYKTWHLVPTVIDTPVGQGAQNDYYVIEGIGCIQYPFFPADPTTFESSYALTCFSTNGTTPPLSQKVGPYFDNTSSCSLTFGLAVNNVASTVKSTYLFPNPIDETSIIILPYIILSGIFTVQNDVGQIIINAPFQNKEEVLIGDKIHIPGIYYYRVTDNETGKMFPGKFVSQ